MPQPLVQLPLPLVVRMICPPWPRCARVRYLRLTEEAEAKRRAAWVRRPAPCCCTTSAASEHDVHTLHAQVLPIAARGPIPEDIGEGISPPSANRRILFAGSHRARSSATGVGGVGNHRRDPRRFLRIIRLQAEAVSRNAIRSPTGCPNS